jgi:NADPH:quinone reductase-like Zn-dependent oxidoreductase
MRAWEIRNPTGIDALAPAERPDPRPGPGQVLVRMKAASLNYRDLLIVTGAYSRNLPLPLVPVSDAAGEVVEVGPGVSRFRAGDRVAGVFMQSWVCGELTDAKSKSGLGGAIDGVMAERVVFAEEGLVAVPEHLSDEEAATLPCAGVTAWNGLIASGGLRAGETVLTLGSGGVSVFALQFARLAGATVIATSSSDEKLDRLRQLGAAEGINYRTTPEWHKRVRELTGGRGVDHVVEVGGAGTLARSLQAVRLGGHVSLIGVLAGGNEVNPLPILMRNVRVQGIFVGSREHFEAMNRAITAHRLRPVVDRVFGFDELPAAYRHLQSGSHFGKVCVRF